MCVSIGRVTRPGSIPLGILHLTGRPAHMVGSVRGFLVQTVENALPSYMHPPHVFPVATALIWPMNAERLTR